MTIFGRLSDVPPDPGYALARIPVTVDLDGLEVGVWTHVLRGARPGPTLALIAGVHGNEWGHLEFLFQFVHAFRPEETHGTVLVVPTANPTALGALTRSTPDDADQPDVNRSFPGEGRRFTWLAEQIATTLASEIVARADAVIDFHLGIWGATMGSSIVGVDYTDPSVNRRCMDLALMFGVPLIFASRVVGAFPGPRSLLGYAAEKAGVPISGSMLGGTGFGRSIELDWQRANLRGIRNVMIHLGMLSGDRVLPDRYLRYATVERVNPHAGGLHVPVQPTDRFGREVQAGEVLGRVISPYSLEVIEELTAPMDGYLAYWARDYPVHPGDWAFGVIPRDHPGTESLDRTALAIAPWSDPD